MDKRTTAISARVNHEYIDYMRMHGINVNRAINIGLRTIVMHCQHDENFRRQVVIGSYTYDDLVRSVIDLHTIRP